MGRKQEGQVKVPFYYTHVWKNVLLLVLSVITIPISATLVFIGLAVTKLHDGRKTPTQKPRQPSSTRKTILITGVSMTKGLVIARSLAQNTHHRIIGADISSISPGRFSPAISKYYRLETPHGDDAEPYIDSILGLIRSEKVDLWISCSSVIAAVEDGQVVRLAQKQAKQQNRTFEAIQFSEDVVERFHSKDKFIDYIASINLTIPESYRCTSPEEALNILLRAFDTPSHDGTISPTTPAPGRDTTPLGKQYIMKPIGVDDHARNAMMTLLPLSTAAKTTSYIRNLGISRTNPFQLQQYIQGSEYCTHALVIKGQVKAFTSCPSLELLMHYEALPIESTLQQQMLKFTERVAKDGGKDFTGHLSFDFLVEDKMPRKEEDGPVLYPIECNPRAHTAVVLFEKTPEMAAAYLDVFNDNTSTSTSTSTSSPIISASKEPTKTIIFPSPTASKYFWLGHDLVTYGLLPILDTVFGQGSVKQAITELSVLAEHLVYWRDGTYMFSDPWPFFVLYHVYWPMKFVESLRKGKAWSRINVSTTKMFEE